MKKETWITSGNIFKVSMSVTGHFLIGYLIIGLTTGIIMGIITLLTK